MALTCDFRQILGLSVNFLPKTIESLQISVGYVSCRLPASYRNRLAVPLVKLFHRFSVVLHLWPYCLECSTGLP